MLLGAYGCGVFKQNPQEVATIFKSELKSYKWSFDEVIFAIPAGETNEIFREVLLKNQV